MAVEYRGKHSPLSFFFHPDLFTDKPDAHVKGLTNLYRSTDDSNDATAPAGEDSIDDSNDTTVPAGEDSTDNSKAHLYYIQPIGCLDPRVVLYSLLSNNVSRLLDILFLSFLPFSKIDKAQRKLDPNFAVSRQGLKIN